MMHVEYAIHARRDDIVYYLLHTLHPCLVHIAVGINMLNPCHWHTHSIETACFKEIDLLLSGHWLTPTGLIARHVGEIIRNIIAMGIKGVAEVEAQTHVLDRSHCTLLKICDIEVYVIARDNEILRHGILPPCF